MVDTSFDNKFLESLAATPIDVAIPPESVASVLANAPFVKLAGCFNLRDLGAFVPNQVRPRKVFRSGALDYVPETHRASLRDELGVSKIFDFRRNDEVASRQEIDGIEVVPCPYKDGLELPNELRIPDFAPREDGSLGPGYRNMYDDILIGYKTGFRLVFEAIRDAAEGEAILFHCNGEFAPAEMTASVDNRIHLSPLLGGSREATAATS